MQTAIIVATFVVSTFGQTALCTSKPYYNNIHFVGANKKPESTAANVQSLRQFLIDPDYCLGNCILPRGPLTSATVQQKAKSCTDVGFRLSATFPPVKYPNDNAATSCHWSGATASQTGIKSKFKSKTKMRTHRGFRSVCKRRSTDELLIIIGNNAFSNTDECGQHNLGERRTCFTMCNDRTPLACNHFDVVGVTHAAVNPSQVRPCRIVTVVRSARIGYTQLCARTITPPVVQPVAPVLGRTVSTHLAKNEYVNQYKVESDVDAFLGEENELQNERLYVFTIFTSMVLGCCICGSLIFGLTCAMMAAEVIRRRFSSKTEENLI